MEPAEILQSLFDQKVLSILRLFLKEDGKQFYLREVAKLAGVSPASTYRILKKLVALNIVKATEIKTLKLYSLETSRSADFLKGMLEVDIVQYFVEKASIIHGVEELLLMGAKDKAKANFLILGHDTDSAAIKSLCAEIREKYGFSINQMTLTREQYEQMFAMGLYPGTKKVLFRKS